MALSFTRFSWWLLGGKEKEQVSNGSSINPINSLGDWGLRGDSENLKFYSMNGASRRMPSSSSTRKVKRKWKNREERRIEKEDDVVLVPSDGVCLSASESDDSDWSIGWFEPHTSDFLGDVDVDDDDSFAVLVPCYRHDCKELEKQEMEVPNKHFFSAMKNLPYEYSAEGKWYIEQWLSSKICEAAVSEHDCC